MTASGPSPELILSLSRDQVSIHLLANSEKGYQAWQSTYPVAGLYLHEEIAGILDKALSENPSLFEEFACVHILVRDRPNLLLPGYLRQEGKIAKVASRYLRVRAGDTLKLDETSSDDVVCYSLPKSTVYTVSEYFRDIANVHMVSLLWSEIQQLPVSTEMVAYYCLTGNTLIVLATNQGQLHFSRIIEIHHQEDVQYYVIACNRLLRPNRKINIQLEDDKSPFLMLYSPHTSFDQRLTFASIPTLLQRHVPCVS